MSSERCDAVEDDADEPVWVKSAETVWYAIVNYDHLPEAISWVALSTAGLRVVYLTVYRWPRTAVSGTTTWLCWLGWQWLLVPGSTALQDAQDNMVEALKVTREVAAKLMHLVAAWVEVFLPFFDDMCSSAWAFWWRLALHQRVMVFLTGLAGYAVLEAFTMFKDHQHTLTKVIFHATFLLGGPGLWYATALLPDEWLRPCLRHAITTVPTIWSLVALVRSPGSSDGAVVARAPVFASASSPRLRRGLSFMASPPVTSTELQKLWLSYWACWPMVKLLETTVGVLPDMVPHAEPKRLHAEVQRAALTFVAWLQLWQGSRLLHRTIRYMLSRTHLLEFFTGTIGLPICKGLGMLVSQFRWAATGRFRTRVSKLSVLVMAVTGGSMASTALAAAGVALLLAIVRIYYRAWRAATGVATAMLWCLAAADTGNTLVNGEEHVYNQKLAFWVFARLWSALTKMPYVGSVLGLATPYIFALLHLAGGTLLEGLLTVFRTRLCSCMAQAAAAVTTPLEGARVAVDNATTSEPADSCAGAGVTVGAPTASVGGPAAPAAVLEGHAAHTGNVVVQETEDG